MNFIKKLFDKKRECLRIKHLKKNVIEIRKILEAQGMAPGHWDEEWFLPFTEGQLYNQCHALMIAVFEIQQLLIHEGLADEIEFLPLRPRWRIDGHKHHNRNWRYFQSYVLGIMRLYKSDSEYRRDSSHSVKICNTLYLKQFREDVYTEIKNHAKKRIKGEKSEKTS